MNEDFDRAPGAGRTRNHVPADPGFAVLNTEDGDTKSTLFNQMEPLRQPRTSPPFGESNTAGGASSVLVGADNTGQSTTSNYVSDSRGSRDVDSLVKSSNLSANAPEFVPSGMISYEDPAYYDDSEHYYGEPSLADAVSEFLGHLSSSPGSFESDIEYISGTLNSWVTTEELLKELVELVFTQSTAIPNFSYTGARLCNHLSHHLAFSSQSGSFRQLLLQRCHTEYEKREAAVRGDPDTQKKFHSFVLFLGELYLNLEIKSVKGPPNRADVLLGALKDLLDSLLSNPADANLICTVKLLKLTGSILEDTWIKSRKRHMDELIQRIRTVLLDTPCSRDVKQMLLKLVELRSSDWGRVSAAAASSNATPDNDPNYFMNEPTFYTEDGTPFTAADPEKYQEMLDRQDYFPDYYGENGNEDKDKTQQFTYTSRMRDTFEDQYVNILDREDRYEFEDEMDPEIEEAYENFCLESERQRQQ